MARRSISAYPERRRSPWWKRASILSIVGAAVFLGLAVTQFRFLRANASAGTVVLAMDVSESMNRTDVQPTRLEAAKAAARAFLEELPPELRVGLVAFAGTADVLVPPTEARDEVRVALGALRRGEGTVIGDGLSSALDAIEAEWRRNGEGPAAVVLLSDGRDTGSQISPDRAALRAGPLEVAVNTVALGRVDDAEGNDPGANVALLRRIAETTGGSTFTADTAGGLIRVYETLRSRLSRELAITDYGELFVGISAVLAIVATAALLVSLRFEG